ncbi:hypothetical protein C4F49_05690 [Sphingobacterium sp. KB22]|uniref:Uncharacterized protein n=1 Tax=Sphingobacterium hungaricum TaxID=2082723 RepID=A0A928UYZ7_9SPHI|nr:hypothetical protein [Sphingobacterium hungaricum]
MKKIPLLPSYFRWIGLTILLISFCIYLIITSDDSARLKMKTFVFIDNSSFYKDGNVIYFGFSEVNITVVVIALTALIGLCGIAFSRKQIEDEFISSLRLFSWSWSVLSLMIYVIFVSLFVFGTMYLTLMVFIPHFLLIIFILIFNYQLFKYKRSSRNEE